MKTIAVALSGGIDSSLSAYLLQKEGYEVIGLHADLGQDDPSLLQRIREIASFLKIPLQVISLEGPFREKVVSCFISEYSCGRTPNPCVVCNPVIKFGLLFQQALTLGADYLATGHYARVTSGPFAQGLTIARGLDSKKDQSYFLHRLPSADLSKFVFPLGTWTKERVRETVRRIGLPAASNGESQDICFLPKGGYRKFLSEKMGDSLNRPGDMVNLRGEKLGTHQGLFAYTIGQRRGLGLPAPAPYYVIRLEAEENRLVLGGKKDLESWGCRLKGVHWLCRPPNLQDFELSVQIRFRHKPAKARLQIKENGHLGLRFLSPQSAVTPGQAAVFYLNDRVLGGGWIEERD